MELEVITSSRLGQSYKHLVPNSEARNFLASRFHHAGCIISNLIREPWVIYKQLQKKKCPIAGLARLLTLLSLPS